MVNYNLLFMGTFQDLDTIESGAPWSENAQALNNQTLIALSVVSLNADLNGLGNLYDQNEQPGANFGQPVQPITYDRGNGPVTTRLDSTTIHNVTVTRADGSVFSGQIIVAQMENGDLCVTSWTASLNNTAVRSITFSNVSNDTIQLFVGSSLSGTTAVGGNQPPVFTNISNGQTISIPENTTFVVNADASDPNNDPLTFSIVGGRMRGGSPSIRQRGCCLLPRRPTLKARAARWAMTKSTMLPSVSRTAVAGFRIGRSWSMSPT